MNAPSVLEYKDIYIARPTSGSPSSVDQGSAGGPLSHLSISRIRPNEYLK